MVNYWTISAYNCYNRGCVCNGCEYQNFFSDGKCRMKESVLALVRKIGKPPENFVSDLTDSELTVIDAVHNGCTTKNDIANYTNMTTQKVQGILDRLCQYVMVLGFSFKKAKNRLPELIKILKEMKE